MKLNDFNQLQKQDADVVMAQCCTATSWINQVVAGRPYQDMDVFIAISAGIWNTMKESDLLEAFDGHPKIGDPNSLKEKYQSTLGIASNEQSGVKLSNDQVLDRLAACNQAYLDKYGFIFIICATGKSAEQMLDSIERRLLNIRPRELTIAAGEQWKITLIRLNNLFDVK